jgi:hypothetical protein
MKSITTWVIGAVVLVAAVLAGYWFWVPDVGALRTWDQFLELPSLQCTIGDGSVEGLSGVMYMGNGRLRADYKVEGQGVSSTFHTIVYEDGSAYTWADNIQFAEKSTFNLGGDSTESNLFSISRCRRSWSVDPEMFVLPIGKDFRERGVPGETEYDSEGNLLPEEVAPTN